MKEAAPLTKEETVMLLAEKLKNAQDQALVDVLREAYDAGVESTQPSVARDEVPTPDSAR